MGAAVELASLMWTCGSSSYHETAKFSKSTPTICPVWLEIKSTICSFVPCVLLWLHSHNETETCKLQYNEIPACSTCHVPRERAVPHLIALRKHDRPRHSDFFGVVKKKIHFYFTCCRYAIWMNRQSEFVLFCFFFIVQFYQTCRIPDETKKNLGPKISPQNFQALISTSPEIFPWRINVRISKCLWLVYLSYHPLNFTFSHLTVWTARPALYACGTTPIRLFWIPFEIPT